MQTEEAGNEERDLEKVCRPRKKSNKTVQIESQFVGFSRKEEKRKEKDTSET
jgi:hypothetical protein